MCCIGFLFPDARKKPEMGIYLQGNGLSQQKDRLYSARCTPYATCAIAKSELAYALKNHLA